MMGDGDGSSLNMAKQKLCKHLKQLKQVIYHEALTWLKMMSI